MLFTACAMTACTYAYMLWICVQHPELQSSLDTSPGWRGDTAHSLLASLDGFVAYRHLNQVDSAFALMYAGCLRSVLQRLWPGRRWLHLLPCAAGVADLVENFCVRSLMDTFVPHETVQHMHWWEHLVSFLRPSPDLRAVASPGFDNADWVLSIGPCATILKFAMLVPALLAIGIFTVAMATTPAPGASLTEYSAGGTATGAYESFTEQSVQHKPTTGAASSFESTLNASNAHESSRHLGDEYSRGGTAQGVYRSFKSARGRDL